MLWPSKHLQRLSHGYTRPSPVPDTEKPVNINGTTNLY